MPATSLLAQGEDAKIITHIAHTYYGTYANMFEALDWPESGKKMMTSAPAHIVRAFGSIKSFQDFHVNAEATLPLEAIFAKNPNVVLTSTYGFAPERWGHLGFTKNWARQKFLDMSKPGVLVVIYGGPGAPVHERRKILGILQCSHEIGTSEDFTDPIAYQLKQQSPKDKDRWNFGVRVTRAWRAAPETTMTVSDFAPETYAPKKGLLIGSQGVVLSKYDARNILKLELREWGVYGHSSVGYTPFTKSIQALTPSRPGPVSQQSHFVKAAEGPKHLYILRLKGNEDAFLGQKAKGRWIVKAGFSKSPRMRCDSFNKALPAGAYKWELIRAGKLSGMEAYPSSQHAKAGEAEMHGILAGKGESLGGEFFLASKAHVEEAWELGNQAAKNYNPVPNS